MKAQLTKTSYHPFPELSLALPASERRMVLFAGDLISLLLASAIANWAETIFRMALLPHSIAHNTDSLWLLLLSVAWIVIAGISECYDLHVASRWVPIVLRVVIASFVASLLYVLLFFVLARPVPSSSVITDILGGIGAPPRFLALIFLVATLILVALWRVASTWLFTSEGLRRRTVVVGAGRSGQSLIRATRQRLRDYDIVGFIDDDPAKQGLVIEGIPVLGNHDMLVRQVRAKEVNEIILAVTNDMHDQLLTALMHCYEHDVMIKPMALFYEETLGQVPVEHLGNKWLPVPFWSSALLPTFYRTVKRMLDIILALFGLICTLPLFPLVALALYLDCPGPIFYFQERLGRGGKTLRIMKFRSMVPNAEQGGRAIWATKSDQRITRVGKFLRRTRIDELPQLVNVLKGEMSFVGPRPERAQFVSQLEQEIPFFRARLSVKPGLTGWAQINYGYGSTVDDARMKLQYDLYYIKHRSLTMDLLIIFRTIMVVLAFRGI